MTVDRTIRSPAHLLRHRARARARAEIDGRDRSVSAGRCRTGTEGNR